MKKTKAEIREREKRQAQLKGVKGKGIKGFVTFCKFCWVEYKIEGVDKCTHCGRETITYEERYAELRDKLEEHKVKQANKKERRSRWENWQKTQAMFYKKTSTNYKKWDVFESSEEEVNSEDQEPIVPENDPAFKAME
jgi:archaellum component FlaD/FlaE